MKPAHQQTLPLKRGHVREKEEDWSLYLQTAYRKQLAELKSSDRNGDVRFRPRSIAGLKYKTPLFRPRLLFMCASPSITTIPRFPGTRLQNHT